MHATNQSTLVELWDKTMKTALTTGDIYEIEYDVFSTISQTKFSFVRCMNVLNSGYFSDRRICSAIANIAGSLLDGGILLIGRTKPDGSNHATFFKKTASRFTILSVINSGYERSSLVENIFSDFPTT